MLRPALESRRLEHLDSGFCDRWPLCVDSYNRVAKDWPTCDNDRIKNREVTISIAGPEQTGPAGDVVTDWLDHEAERTICAVSSTDQRNTRAHRRSPCGIVSDPEPVERASFADAARDV